VSTILHDDLTGSSRGDAVEHPDAFPDQLPLDGK